MRLMILGAGGYGRTIADVAAQLERYDEILFFDDGITAPDVVGKCADYFQYVADSVEFYPAFGNNQTRLLWMDKLENTGCVIAKLIHPSAYLSPRSTVAPGCVVLPKAIVNTDCVIGRGCIINLGAIVDHGCVIEEGVHICLGAIVKAENRIPKYMKIEAGEVVANRAFPL